MLPQPILKVTDLTKKFGSLLAVNRVSLEIHEGEIAGLIGPNGAGKTTFFNSITGIYPPDEGSVFFRDVNTTHFLPHKICKLGMSRTFQVTRAFNMMTIEDAVRVGAYNRATEATVGAVVDEIVEFCGLSAHRKQKCGDVGLAMLRRVELARALATRPKMLLLDEAGAGLTASELAVFMSILRKINSEGGITLCIVEHVMQMVMGICQRIFVLDSGELIASGTPDEISSNTRVIEAYLGKRAVHAARS
jgi:branched-chain amino acid transport system ATP-binding protein